jgi:hypothetical protein
MYLTPASGLLPVPESTGRRKKNYMKIIEEMPKNRQFLAKTAQFLKERQKTIKQLLLAMK